MEVKTATLSRMYEQLTPEERVSLAFSAAARDDDAEVNRLHASAPRERWFQVHHARQQHAITFIAMRHQLEQLESAAYILLAKTRLVQSADDEPKEEFWSLVAAINAYVIHTRNEAWHLFCSELGLVPADVVCGMPGDIMLDLVGGYIPETKPSRDEALNIMQRLFNDAPTHSNLLTVASRSDELRTLYCELLGGEYDGHSIPFPGTNNGFDGATERR